MSKGLKAQRLSWVAGLYVFAAVVLAMAASACTGEEAAPSTTVAAVWETYDSVEELAAAADLVAVVEVGTELRRFPVLNDDGSEAFRRVIHAARVEEVIMGDARLASTTIEITYIDFGPFSANVTPYEEGERLVMFLVPTGPTAEGTWAPLSSNEGVFEFTTGDQVLNRGQGLSGQQFTLQNLRRLVSTAAGA
jgi:hypothetical protein